MEELAPLRARIQRDINCLSDTDKFKRKRGVAALHAFYFDGGAAVSLRTAGRCCTLTAWLANRAGGTPARATGSAASRHLHILCSYP